MKALANFTSQTIDRVLGLNAKAKEAKRQADEARKELAKLRKAAREAAKDLYDLGMIERGQKIREIARKLEAASTTAKRSPADKARRRALIDAIFHKSPTNQL